MRKFIIISLFIFSSESVLAATKRLCEALLATQSQPGVLSTSQFILTPTTSDELHQIIEIFGDRKVWDAQNYHYVNEDWAVWPFAFDFNLNRTAIHNLRFSVREKVSGKTVGFVTLIPVAGDPKAGEIAYVLAPEKWGQGVMTEVLPVFIKYFSTLYNLTKIVGEVSADNAASKRVLEKLRFKFEESFTFSDPHIIRPEVQWERWSRKVRPSRQK